MTQMAHFMNDTTTDLGFGLDMLYLYYSTLMTTVLAATAAASIMAFLWPLEYLSTLTFSESFGGLNDDRGRDDWAFSLIDNTKILFFLCYMIWQQNIFFLLFTWHYVFFFVGTRMFGSSNVSTTSSWSRLN